MRKPIFIVIFRLAPICCARNWSAARRRGTERRWSTDQIPPDWCVVAETRRDRFSCRVEAALDSAFLRPRFGRRWGPAARALHAAERNSFK